MAKKRRQVKTLYRTRMAILWSLNLIMLIIVTFLIGAAIKMNGGLQSQDLVESVPKTSLQKR